MINLINVSKTYRIYSKPHLRIFQALADHRGSQRSYCHEVQALRDVSLTVTQGESLAIIGLNGSGKSTLLQAITGNLRTTKGIVEVNGSVSALLELGSGFNPDFSGRENIRLASTIRGLSSREFRQLEEQIIEFADIGEFIDEPVRTYSSGMYVRLAFSAAVHIVPDILIVDEALAVGDVFFQQKCFDFMHNSMRDVTKIMVTHDLSAVARLATRCIVLDAGQICFDGDPLQAIEHFTAFNGRTAQQSPQEAEAGENIALESGSAAIDMGDLWSPPIMSPELSERTFSVVSAEVLSDGNRIGKRGQMQIRNGSKLSCRFRCFSNSQVQNPIIGYLVRDRLGNAVFGMNTATKQSNFQPLQTGFFDVELGFSWPDIVPGEYSVTIGLGDGTHGLYHRIVGWEGGVFSVITASSNEFHGVINGDLFESRLSPVSDSEEFLR